MRYDAFISYRHTELDLYTAKRIHRKLETFRVPRAVAKKGGKKKIRRVFRDQEELPIGSDLEDNIRAALEESEYLIVICSPRTPESYWVQKEISTFIGMHGREHVLAVLIEGEPGESFPAQLLIDEEGRPVEPLAADVRGASKGERNRKMQTELMRLAAPILHCTYDDLRQRHRERRLRQAAAVGAAVAAGGVLFGMYSAYNASLIRQNYEEKQRSQSRYLAEESLQLLGEGDRRSAVLVAMEALPSGENSRPYEPEAQYALSRALYCYEQPGQMLADRVLRHDLPVSGFSLSEDGERAVSYDQGGAVYVWNVGTGEILARIPPQTGEGGDSYSVSDAVLIGERIIIRYSGCLKSVTFDGQEEWSYARPAYISRIFREEGLALYVDAEDMGTFCLVDIDSGEITGRLKTGERIKGYSSKAAISRDASRLAVADSGYSEGRGARLFIFDREAGTSVEIGVGGDTVLDLLFTEDDSLLVTSFGKDEETGAYISYLDKLDSRNGELLWGHSMETEAAARIRYKRYEERDTGQVQNVVLMRADDRLYRYDALSGEQVMETRAKSQIQELLMARNRSIAYLLDSSGTINAINTEDGSYIQNSEIQIKDGSLYLCIENGIVLSSAVNSPDITVIRGLGERGWMPVAEHDGIVSSVSFSPDGSCYAVYVPKNYFVENSEEEIWFYRTGDNRALGKLNSSEMLDHICYVDDKWCMVIDNYGKLFFYNPETGEREELPLEDALKTTLHDCVVNKGATKAFLYSREFYVVLDLPNRKLQKAGRLPEGSELQGAVLSKDGTAVYCDLDGRICRLEVETGQWTPIGTEEYGTGKWHRSSGMKLALSSDEKLLAVCCQDDVVRVLDIERGKTVQQIPFSGKRGRFLYFTEDAGKLVLQGDDYFFRVYDMEAGAFSYVSEEQYERFGEVKEDAESGVIALKNISGLVLLDRETCRLTAYIEDGQAFLPEQEAILTGYRYGLYQVPYLDLEALLQEAKRQFGTERLTDLERIRYHVE